MVYKGKGQKPKDATRVIAQNLRTEPKKTIHVKIREYHEKNIDFDKIAQEVDLSAKSYGNSLLSGDSPHFTGDIDEGGNTEEWVEKYRQYYHQKRSQIFYEQYINKFDEMIEIMDDIDAARLKAQEWAEKYPDDKAREYTKEQLMQYVNRRLST